MMPKILLIPGNMCDARLWRPVADRLTAAGHTATALGAPTGDSIAAMAQGVLSAHTGPLVSVGFSMGAIVAATMATLAPDRISGLGLVAFNASADLPDRAAARPRQQERVREGALAAIVSDELKPNYLALANRDNAALRALVMDMAEAVGPARFLSQSEALRTRNDLRPDLAGLAMPVMLAAGREDRLCPPAWHAVWRDAIGPHARLHVIDDAGHLVPLEQPEALADALIDWIEEDFKWPRQF